MREDKHKGAWGVRIRRIVVLAAVAALVLSSASWLRAAPNGPNRSDASRLSASWNSGAILDEI